MPLYLNVFLSFALAVVWVKRLETRRHMLGHFLSWPLILGMLFQAVVLTPIQSFHFRFHHDWSLGYAIDPDLHPAFDQYLALWAFLAALIPLGAAFLGHWVGRIPIEKPKSKTPLIVLSATAAVALSLTLFLWREWLHIGTYEQFFQGEAHFLFFSATGIFGILQLVASAAFVAYGPRLLDYIPKESASLG